MVRNREWYCVCLCVQVLFPSASIRKLQLWTGYYLRWNPRMRPQVGPVPISGSRIVVCVCR